MLTCSLLAGTPYPRTTMLVLAGLVLIAGCHDRDPGGPADPDPVSPGPAIISNPISVVLPAATPPAVGAPVVYVSLPMGTFPGGIEATIRNLHNGSTVTVGMIAGGLDPVAVAAAVGDTLELTVTLIGKSAVRFVYPVPAHKPPVIVRTDPPPLKRDVPLNAIVVIVFSEPLDSATVDTGSVKLWHGTTPVSGSIRFADAEHLRVEFHPDDLLAGQTDYQLVLSQGIRDLDGTALASAVTVPFTTGTSGPATGLVFASVSAGRSHTCGVAMGGAAYCWGDNYGGQLGNGTTASSTTPMPVAGGLRFAAVSAGNNHTCGVTTTGALYCWGAGGGTSVDRTPRAGPTPELIAGGLTFATVSLGDYQACGVTTAGAAHCWGEGLLGDGVQHREELPGEVVVAQVAGGLTFASVSADGPNCGVTTAGVAYCWGSNILGQLGTGSTGPEPCYPYQGAVDGWDCSTVPAAVAGGLTFRQVESEGSSACGLTTGGTTYCWGSNHGDFLGLAAHPGLEQCDWGASFLTPCTRVPLAVPDVPTLVSLSRTDTYTCGLTSTGVAYCWGYLLSMIDLLSNTGPVVVPGGLTFARLSTGPRTTCGVTPAGVAYCLGDNHHGALGDGTTTSSSVPVKVAGQP